MNPEAEIHAATVPRALLAALVAVEEDERRQIARDLHDRVGQNITACQLLLPLLRESANDASAATLDQLRLITGELARDLHEVVMALRPPPDDLPLAVALEAYVEDWSARTGVVAALELGGATERPPAIVEDVAYRVAQHALRNVAEHAHAAHVSVVIERGTGELVLLVEDDGKGFDAEQMTAGGTPDGHGLAAMRQRAAVVGGSLTIESAPGRGTTIVARLPLA